MRLAHLTVVGFLFAAFVGCGGGGKAPLTGGSEGTGVVQGRLATKGTRQGRRFVIRVQGMDEEALASLRVEFRDDGFFRVEGVPAGEQVITVEDPDTLQGAVVVAFVRPGSVTDVGEVRPRRLGKISGIVAEVDENGNRVKPIRGARVVARPIQSLQDNAADLSRRPFFAAVTNAHGSYDLLVPQGEYLVQVRHRDYDPASARVMVQELQTIQLDFGLTPRPHGVGVVFGRVIAQFMDQKVPVPGALVVLFPKGGGFRPMPLMNLTIEDLMLPPLPPSEPLMRFHGGGHHPFRPFLFTFTDADGSFDLANVPAGDYIAVAFKSGYGRDEKDITVVTGERMEVNFLLVAHVGIVEGRVTDGETGEPLAGALVVAIRKGDPWWDWDDWRPRPMSRHDDDGDADWDEWEGWDDLDDFVGDDRPSMVVPPLPPIEPPIRAGVLTDEGGHYRLLVPSGEYFLAAIKVGYVWQAKKVRVEKGQRVIVDFALRKRTVGGPVP